jgi:hypothetical protein
LLFATIVSQLRRFRWLGGAMLGWPPILPP